MVVMTNKFIVYSVTPYDPAGHRLRVTLQVPAPAPEGQELFMPAWIPGSYLIRDFARQVEIIRASSSGQAIGIRKTGNHTWRCDPCAGPLDVEYTVYAWDLSVRSAHVDETHAFFNGTSVFLGVSGQTDQPCRVQLNPPPHTGNWKVYTSMPLATGHPDAAQRHGFGLYQAPDYDALVDHPIEMGTPQVISFTAHGALHEMVFTGVAPNLDLERIAADTKRICEAQIALFEPDTLDVPFLDSSDRYVFMTMVTGDGYGGLEHRASTALMTSRHDLPVRGRDNAGKGYQDFLGLVSHEYFHTWNVKRIKPAVFAPYTLTQENFTQLLWVFEGFTSYYDELMLLRSGVISEEDYLTRLGKVIAHVERGPGRLKQSVADSSFDAWTRFYKQDENSPNALVSYYTKGSLVALGLDITIRQASDNHRSLDDVMRLMWQRYGRDFYRGNSQNGVAEDDMPALIHEATGVDVADFIARYAYGCDDIPLQQLLAARGITLERKSATDTPDLGIRTRANGQHLSIATAYENGAAHRAGLSAGDTLVAIEGLRVTDTTSMNRVLSMWQPGDTVQVHVFRRDELRSFDVTLDAPAVDQVVLTRKSSNETQ